MPKIETLGTDGKPNGWILPIWNELETPEFRPAQVYVTAIAPRSRKGPHLHMVREGRFVCLSGQVVVRRESRWDLMTPGSGIVHVPAGMPCALYNYGDTEALVMNMPTPAWSAENPDDHPVTDWQDPADWPPAGDYSTGHAKQPIVRFKR